MDAISTHAPPYNMHIFQLAASSKGKGKSVMAMQLPGIGNFSFNSFLYIAEKFAVPTF